jgi:hypothetical protein
MVDRPVVRSNHQAFAIVVVLGIAGVVQVGCTSCLITARPTSTERLEEALRKDALRKSGTLSSPPPVAPLVCPIIGPGQPTSPGTQGGHNVILSWKASAPADSKHAAAVGYCIYRGVKHQDPAPVLLNSTPFPGTSCADDLVINGTNYYYVVRAISANKVTSVVSNEVPAVIPQQSRPSTAAASAPLCRQPAAPQ